MEILLSVLNSYSQITNYRELFRQIGFLIHLDFATRQDGGEVHIVLLEAQAGEIGFLILHYEYDSTYADMFSEGRGAGEYHQYLFDRIRWFDTLADAQLFFELAGDGFWKAHRIGRDAPELSKGFIDALHKLDFM